MVHDGRLSSNEVHLTGNQVSMTFGPLASSASRTAGGPRKDGSASAIPWDSSIAIHWPFGKNM